LASSVSYKDSVGKDLKKLDKPTAKKVVQQLEQSLSKNPDTGEPLSGEFRGLFKYRVGDYRVVYVKVPGGVLILRIRHRRDVYR